MGSILKIYQVYFQVLNVLEAEEGKDNKKTLVVYIYMFKTLF